MNRRVAIAVGVALLLSAFVSLAAGFIWIEFRLAAFLAALIDIVAAIVFFGIAYWKRDRVQ